MKCIGIISSVVVVNSVCFQLELKGMHIEEGTDSGADPQFLMELMEINEALAEVQTQEEANKIGQSTKGLKICHSILLRVYSHFKKPI